MAGFRDRGVEEPMLSVEEAQGRVLAAVKLLDVEGVAISDALGRVVREDVAAAYDVPGADNSAMDGYAVRAADVAEAAAEHPVTLRVVDDIPAGKLPNIAIEPGTAARIMTGAVVPPGSDAVIEVEKTDAGSDAVRIFASPKPGTNIRRRGDDMRRGSIVIPSGTLLQAGESGAVAAAGRTTVRVSRVPAIAILSTGDELVEIGGATDAARTVNSNSYSLSALALQYGATPRPGGIVRDEPGQTVAAIEKALDCDFVISSGGVSAGAYDFVKDALDTLGAETSFWKVAMKPGKPVVFARLRDRLYFGLPGNPVSCMVAFHLFVAPALRKAMGMRANLTAPLVTALAGAAIRSKGDRRTYVRVRVATRDCALVAMPMAAQGSHVSTSMVGANGLAVLEEGVTRVEEGSAVGVLIIGPIHGDIAAES